MNERGGLNVLLIPLILTVVFFFGALGFGVWAYMERDRYMNDTEEIVKAEVETAVDEAKTAKDNEFIEKEKIPTRIYAGPSTLGSVQFNYPKTWSGYTRESNTESSVIMHKGLVPGNDKTAYALRVEVENTAYDRVVSAQESNVKSGKLTANPFRLAKLPNIVGTRFEGELKGGKQGVLIVLPLRDKAIRISTESEEHKGDLDQIILRDFTFNP